MRGDHHATTRVRLGRKELAVGICPPRPKALQRKFRTTLLDGVLLALRTMTQAAVKAAVGFGDGNRLDGCPKSWAGESYLLPVSVRRFPSFRIQPLENLTPPPMNKWVPEQPSPWRKS